jgi:hypothetical protein
MNQSADLAGVVADEDVLRVQRRHLVLVCARTMITESTEEGGDQHG